ELFVRPAGSTTWKLATPTGVASNGGLVMAASGATSLVTGFLPSQKLTFSPLAVTSDGGRNWSQNLLLSPGFRAVPNALAVSPRGQLLALTNAGNVEAGTGRGATWRTLATQRTLADSPVGRACGVRTLTAAAWTPAGSPLVAASCDRPGATGIFAFSAGGWRRAGPALPASLSRRVINVIGLATTGQRTTVVLAAMSAAGATIVTGWSADGGTTWQLSPALSAGRASRPSVSIWADGSVGLVLPTGAAASETQSATIGWQSASWRTLPPLPARTATLAAGPGGQPQVLTVSGTALTAWQLTTGSSRWTMTQTIRVPVPYGSSG
ncbi:MAG TPA: hypothetical protein VLM11_21255, partial [Streptosporangiaceae bacterium]|nr:hypothetical protein [Streptosporangiaceae bacterium]